MSSPVGAPGWRGRVASFHFKSKPKVRPTPAARSTSDSRARLSLVLLGYCLGIVAVIKLAPFAFSFPSIRVETTAAWPELVANVLLFVPLGFLYPLTRRGADVSLVRVVSWGAAIGAGFEVVRACEVDRYASAIDIAANAVGACAGGWVLTVVHRRIRSSARLAGRLSLEIPLVGLIYMMLPLLVVTSLSATSDRLRALALVPLGLLAARLMSAVQDHHFGPAGVLRNRAMAVVAATWMALGIFPVLSRDPMMGGTLVVLVGLATLYELSNPAVRGSERRFEADVLKRSTPYIVMYFITAIVAPLAFGVGPWRAGVWLTGFEGDLARQMVQALQPVAAVAVLGYMLAEARGRRELAFRKMAMRIAMEAAGVALAIEAGRGFQRGAGASGIEFVLIVVAALAGAGIYHHQRERVRWILIHRGDAALGRRVA